MELASTEKTVQEMRSNGAVDEAIYRTRAAAVSVEAADRLAQLDQAEAAWKTPYQRLSRRAQQTSRRQRAGR